MKIDTEGCGGLVLGGALKTLNTTKIVFGELHCREEAVMIHILEMNGFDVTVSNHSFIARKDCDE